jgi:hypothetical protein
MSPRILLVLGVVVLLGLAAAVALAGRAVRSRINGGSDRRPTARAPRVRRDWAVTPLPTGVARALTERGLVNAQQLASMSAAEREFFVATVAARVGETGKPKLVAPNVDTNGATNAATAHDPTTTAALVSGGIHCPVCRAPLGQRSDTPLMSRCPGCSRRVGVRIEGARLTVTVQYGAPTPAIGTPVVDDGTTH